MKARWYRTLLIALWLCLMALLSVLACWMPVGAATPDFDALTVIDNCNRSESPLSHGGQWTTDVLASDPSTLTANGTVCVRASTAGLGSAWWNAATYGPDVAMAAQVPDATAGNAQVIYLCPRLIQPGVSGQTDGYCCRFNPFSSTSGVSEYVDDTETSIASCSSIAISNGDHLACMIVGTSITSHVKQSGVWNQVCQVNDGTVSGPGRIGLILTTDAYTLDTLRVETIPTPATAGMALWPILQ